MTAVDPGPYMNEEGGWWVPVSFGDRTAAEAFIPEHGADSLDYLGVETVPCHASDHYHWDDAQCEAAGCYPAVECHHFEEVWE